MDREELERLQDRPSLHSEDPTTRTIGRISAIMEQHQHEAHDPKASLFWRIYCCGICEWDAQAEFLRLYPEYEAKFQLGDRVRVVQLLDMVSSQDLIGKEGTIREVDPLPNGHYNYYMDGHYMHEEELESI